jgi:hypothetical protein
MVRHPRGPAAIDFLAFSAKMVELGGCRSCAPKISVGTRNVL